MDQKGNHLKLLAELLKSQFCWFAVTPELLNDLIPFERQTLASEPFKHTQKQTKT